jgi:hypothetical protein
MLKRKLRFWCEDGGAGQGGDGGQGDAGKGGGSGQGGQDDGGQKGAAAAWPDNWRETYAGGDTKKMERMQRYASPVAAFDAMIAAQNRIQSGEFVTKYPDKGTPEEQSQWRKDNGIPESADKYELGDIKVSETDKPMVDELLKVAHAQNLSPAQTQTLTRYLFDQMDRDAQAQTDEDARLTQECRDKLNVEWGKDYRPNMNHIHGLLDTAPAGLKEKILGGRLSDGTPIGSDPDTLRFLVNLAREFNPAGTLVPGAGTNLGESIDDELGKLEKMMGDRGSEYWKGPKAEQHQARYRELLDGKEKLKKRA